LCGIALPLYKERIISSNHVISKRFFSEAQAPANVIFTDDPKITRERFVRFAQRSSLVNIDHSNLSEADRNIHNSSLALVGFANDHLKWHNRAVIKQMRIDSDLNLN
jgi:hypothetical protein